MVSNAKPNRDEYRFFHSIQTRWMDNDVYGHVNNAVYYSYFDTAANCFLIDKGGLDIHNGEVIALVVASECQYFRPIAYPNVVDVGLRVNRLGNSSVEYGLAIFTDQVDEAAAEGKFVHVFVNRASHKSESIPAPLRLALDAIQLA